MNGSYGVRTLEGAVGSGKEGLMVAWIAVTLMGVIAALMFSAANYRSRVKR